MTDRPAHSRKAFVLGSLLSVALPVGLLAGTSGCASEYAVSGTGAAAASDAIIEVDEMEGSTSKLVKIDFKHLPPPDRIGDGLNTFVVWYVGEDEERAVQAGTMKYDPDSRTGQAAFTAPFESFRVLVTAESEGDIEGPSGNVVLEQEVE